MDELEKLLENAGMDRVKKLQEWNELEEYFKLPLNEGLGNQAASVVDKVKKKFGSLDKPANPNHLNMAAKKLSQAGGQGFLQTIRNKFGKSVATLGIVMTLAGALAGGTVQAGDAEEFVNDFEVAAQQADGGATRQVPDTLDWANPDDLGDDPNDAHSYDSATGNVTSPSGKVDNVGNLKVSSGNY